MATSKEYLLPDVIINLEPPSLGKRLDDLETCIRLQMKQISQLRVDLVELREWQILDKAGK
jgi:hypothetical protein